MNREDWDMLREGWAFEAKLAQGRDGRGIRVLRDPAGFEFINPGLLLISPAQVWQGGHSEPRNPLVQRLFGFLLLGEREGSGGPLIRRVWAEQQWRAPELIEDVENSALHLKLRQVTLLPEASVDAMRAQLGALFDAQDELGRLTLVTAHAEGGLTHARVAGLTNAHPRDVTLKLQELLRKGLLVASGPTRTRRYALSGNAGPGGLEPNFGSSMGQSSPGSEQSSEKSMGSMGNSGVRKPVPEPGPQILAFCVARWRSIPEIAAHLGRSEQSVRKHYLPPLLGAGVLERRYPDNPKHPLQAYRATKTDA